MSESKLVIYKVFPTHLHGKDLPYTSPVNVVTHADYKAFEEVKNRATEMYVQECREHAKTLEELNSLKARVRELVAADNQVNVSENAGHSFEDHTAAFIRFRVAMEALK